MNETELEKQKLIYLYQSIQHAQHTIRLLDTKVGLLFLIICAPIPSLRAIFDLYILSTDLTALFHYAALLILAIWAASLYAAVKSLAPVTTPRLEMEGKPPAGTFFGESLYTFTLMDRLLNTPKQPNHTFDEYLDLHPSSDEELRRELTFVKMQISYIRGIKAMRSSLCANLTISWILAGGFYWLLVLYGSGSTTTP